VNVAVLTLLGRQEDLRDALGFALDRRADLDGIRETILQSMLFAGYPRALRAFEILDEVLEGREGRTRPRKDRLPPRSSTIAFLRRRGRQLFERVYREDADAVMARIGKLHPEFMDWIIEDAYGKVLSRPFLGIEDREILSSAMLVVLDLPPQLTSHLRGALREGATRRALEEMIDQLGLFVGKRARERATACLEKARATI